MGSVAYFAAAIRHDPELFINFMNEETAFIHGKLVRKFYTIGGISMLLQGLFAIFILLVKSYWLLWFSLLLFIAHILLAEYYHIRRLLPAFKKGLDES
jgi:hypothetical protein